MTPSIDQNQLSTTSTIRKVCLLDADVGLLRSMDATVRCRHSWIFPQLVAALSEFIPFRLANWSCRPCDPIARAFEEKDGFLVSGSPILLHDNYVFTSNENDTANH